MKNCKCIKDIKNDLLETFDKSKKLTKKEVKPSLLKGIFQALLRLLAPLM